ncbi:MAG: PDZ domain-containing protein [Gammaproteobacteria bacterium]|nr:PDZ domain-containing protein [Gammaproteobacteria bacterium]
MESRKIIPVVLGTAFSASIFTSALVHFTSDDSHKDTQHRAEILKRIELIEMQLEKDSDSVAGLADFNDRVRNTASLQTLDVSEDVEEVPETDQTVQQGDFEAQPARASLVQQRVAQRTARLQPEYRKQKLIDAGFADEEATRIVQLESEIALRQLIDQYNQRKDYVAQASAEELQQLFSADQLRAEIGEENFLRYLKANGRPTSVAVETVMHGSPGQNAGLLPGDNIVAYDGKQVFSLQDVNKLTIQGAVGESVLIELERDGEPIQLTIPRGPIGISGGRNRFRP